MGSRALQQRGIQRRRKDGWWVENAENRKEEGMRSFDVNRYNRETGEWEVVLGVYELERKGWG